MSSPSRNNESDDRQMPRPTGASLPTQETNSPSFGEGSGNSMTPDQPDRQNAERMVPMSDNLLSTQLSLGTGTSQSRSVIQRRNRGDVQATGALDRYLASDLPSSNLNSNRGRDLSSAQDVDVPAPVIWGTTISLEDAMTMFKGFITNYAQEDSEDAYYSELLAYVKLLIR